MKGMADLRTHMSANPKKMADEMLLLVLVVVSMCGFAPMGLG
jgi:hypothetical protein